MASDIERAATALRDAAMAFPEAHEDFPWGEVAVKVGKKVFLFMHSTGEALSLSCKLPHSSDMALMLPFAKPTGYGLGKSGWVSASFTAKEKPPIELLRDWIEESYRAVAPKKLVARLEPASKTDDGGKKAGGAAKGEVAGKKVVVRAKGIAAATKRAAK